MKYPKYNRPKDRRLARIGLYLYLAGGALGLMNIAISDGSAARVISAACVFIAGCVLTKFFSEKNFRRLVILDRRLIVRMAQFTRVAILDRSEVIRQISVRGLRVPGDLVQ